MIKVKNLKEDILTLDTNCLEDCQVDREPVVRCGRSKPAARHIIMLGVRVNFNKSSLNPFKKWIMGEFH